MSSELARGFRASFAKIRSSRTFVISTVAVAVFVDLFLYSLIIPILPTLLIDRANVSASNLQITLSGLLAAFNASVVICAPITGYLADRWSNRKYFLLGGLCALAGATVLFMVSRNLGLLYFARMLQGASASIVWAVGLALLVDVIGPKDIGVAMGWVSLGLSLGNTLGPLLGGIVYNRAGQYAAFTMGFAAIAVDFVMRCLIRETNRSQVGSVLEEAQVQQESSHGSTESSASGEKPNEAAEVTIQINDPQPGLEYQQANQCLPGLFSIFTLLKYPDMLSSLWSYFLMTVVLTGLEAVIPLRVELTFGWNSQGAGLIFLALVIPTFLGPLVGVLYDRYTSLPLYLAGFVLTLIFCPLLALIQSWSVGNDVLLVFILLMIGIGVSLVLVPGMAEISAFAENKEKDDPNLFGPRGATAQSCALMTIAMAAAGVVGPIIIGAIQSASGWIATSITIGVFAALGIISLVLKTAYERTFVPSKTEGQQSSAQEEVVK